MKKLLGSLALLSLGVVAFVVASLIPPMVAHAQGAAAGPTSAGVDWMGTVALIGTIGIGLGAVLGGIAAILHVIAARTRNATVEVIAKDVDLAHDKLDEVLAVLGRVAPAPKAPQGGFSRLQVMLVVAAAGIALVAALACTMTQARQTTAAGVVTTLNCEDGHIDANALADARAFAAEMVQHWITGSAAPSSAAIKADLAPIKSDLGRCAIAGAVAAVLTVTRPAAAGTAVSALSAAGADRTAVHGAFAVAARELGWAPVKVAGQVL